MPGAAGVDSGNACVQSVVLWCRAPYCGKNERSIQTVPRKIQEMPCSMQTVPRRIQVMRAVYQQCRSGYR